MCTLQLGREKMHEAHQDVNSCIFSSRQCMIRPDKVSMHEARHTMPMHEIDGIKTNTQCRKSTGIAKTEVSARYP